MSHSQRACANIVRYQPVLKSNCQALESATGSPKSGARLWASAQDGDEASTNRATHRPTLRVRMLQARSDNSFNLWHGLHALLA
eukprot:5215713-Amphidinium_carterae.1